MSLRKILPPVLFFLILIAVLELIVKFNFVSASLMPPPSDVFKVLNEMNADFRMAFLESFGNVLVGFALSVFSGLLIAGLFSLSELVKRAVLPFAIFFQTVPIIAIAPLLVIYFGFGASTVIASSFIVSLFPIIANTLLGLENADSAQRDLFKMYKATSFETLWHLKLPCAFNSIYAGLKVSAGLAIIGAVAGEFVAGGGLGAMIDAARTQQRVDIVFAALILLSVMGLILMTALALGRRALLSYRPWSFNEEL